MMSARSRRVWLTNTSKRIFLHGAVGLQVHGAEQILTRAEGPRAEVFSAESIFTYSDQLWLLTGGAADN